MPATARHADDLQIEETESTSQHAARTNRNLLMGAIVILTLFVCFRVLLVWQISRSRKKLVHDLLEDGT